MISPGFTQLPPALPSTVPSARVSDLRPPNGLPFRAGVPNTVTSSPILSAFGPTLVMPCEARAVAEPVVPAVPLVPPAVAALAIVAVAVSISFSHMPSGHTCGGRAKPRASPNGAT